MFASEGACRTFDYQAGEVGYIPFAVDHYVENAGSETLRFLEMFKAPGSRTSASPSGWP
ncbi:hypothetical protein [Pseudofrankia sp. BMG5.37]|uniref:hypothetical protein n=1 Tax=Pseudofrankia sp. BMG5.37 TaxID=3050035 RepID=UPI0018E31F90|nr:MULTISPECIES: hypothetical protein [unclassified Pseudofrankia]MDT3439337.1 hypothetical protein [Pseudofrankia sp. BMG5.37]